MSRGTARADDLCPDRPAPQTAMKKGRAKNEPPAAIETGEAGQARQRRRQDQIGVALAPQAYHPLKALSDATGTPIRDLLSEAIALLLLEHSEPVPAELRRMIRVNIPGLD
jgi:Ribbon-helix-helix domain